MARRRSTTTKKKKKTIPEAIAHIRSSYNNTIITITDMEGNVILWKSAGTEGNKNTKKKTPYAAQKVAEACLKELEGYNTSRLNIQWSKTGPGKDSAIKVFQAAFRDGEHKEVGVLKDATKKTHSYSVKKLGRK